MKGSHLGAGEFLSSCTPNSGILILKSWHTNRMEGGYLGQPESKYWDGAGGGTVTNIWIQDFGAPLDAQAETTWLFPEFLP